MDCEAGGRRPQCKTVKQLCKTVNKAVSKKPVVACACEIEIKRTYVVVAVRRCAQVRADANALFV